MERAHKMLTWCRVEAATLAILLAANEQGPPCGHCLALAAHHRPQLHTHHTKCCSLPSQLPQASHSRSAADAPQEHCRCASPLTSTTDCAAGIAPDT